MQSIVDGSGGGGDRVAERDGAAFREVEPQRPADVEPNIGDTKPLQPLQPVAASDGEDVLDALQAIDAQDESALELGSEAPATDARQSAGPSDARQSAGPSDAPAPKRQTTSSRSRRRGAASKRYVPAIDGLRAFAVFAVIFYHQGLPFAQGGLLGVTVFFVISGYLITGLLTAEWDSSGKIDLPHFWLRRIRRLFPAIVTVIVVIAAVFTVFSPLLLTKMRPDIVPGLFWFENWWYILRDLSYFDAVGAPSPLTHFWSLAIEEQFYLVWPVLLLGMYKAGLRKAGVRRICLVLAVASAAAMALLYDPLGDPSRVYYGTDTRAFSLLIGAWLSFAWPSAQLTEESTRNASKVAIAALDIVGIAAFAGIIAMCVLISGYSDFMYYGGLVICSVLSAVVIAALAHPRGLFAKVAAFKPFVWIGQRSYGMYLWHFPIIELLQPRNATMLPWWIYLVEVALVVVISDLSYRFIETPIRKKGLRAFAAPDRRKSRYGGMVTKLGKDSITPIQTIGTTPIGSSSLSVGDEGASDAAEATFGNWMRTHVPAVVAACAIAAVAVYGIAFVPPVVEGGGEPDAPRVMSATLKKPLVDGVYDIVFIGDSVSLGANEQLNELFPHGLIDTEGNRQFFAGIETFQSYLDQGIVGDTVIFSLSTNGYAEPEELQQIMDLCGSDRTVWFVNIRVPDERCEPNNQAIQECVDSHENARLIDWYSASAGHDDWFIEDGIHLTYLGRDGYTQLVSDSIGYVAPTDENTKYDVTFMGDTVALDAVDGLAALFPKGIVDCSEGRTLEVLGSAFGSYLDKGVVGQDVVFCLGNEARLDRDAVERLVAQAGDDRRVWLVNDRNAAMWCEESNELLEQVAAAHGNVELIDWYGASQGHDDYLAENGMNLTEAGAEAFADTVKAAMGKEAGA